MMKFNTLILPLAASFILSGCVVAAAADLAATTVFTAGKLAVKGTGALIDAAIPDGDDDDKKEKKKSRQEKRKQEKAQQTAGQTQASTAYTYPTPSEPRARYITIDADGRTRETAPYQTDRSVYPADQY